MSTTVAFNGLRWTDSFGTGLFIVCLLYVSIIVAFHGARDGVKISAISSSRVPKNIVHHFGYVYFFFIETA